MAKDERRVASLPKTPIFRCVIEDADVSDASEHGDFGRVRDLLDLGADVHAQDDALRLVIKFGRLDIARFLLDRGANIRAMNYKAKTLRWTPPLSKRSIDHVSSHVTM